MEKISELMDGELDEHQAGLLLARLKREEDLARSWRIFHVIGDALRGERALSPEFDKRLAARLAAEPTVLAPRAKPARRAVTYAMTAAASLSAIALVGWVAFVGNPSGPDLAKSPGVPAATQLASVPSDGRMKEYLIAHQEFSPSTAIQGLAPYIRGVSGTKQLQGR